jgi:disulfide oxidoreductase YuzD
MGFFSKKEDKIKIVIISGSCCNPSMATLDNQARLVVERAVSETGITAQIKAISATSAIFGGIPQEVKAKVMTEFNRSGQILLPVILIDGKAVSYGMPNYEDVKSALLKTKDVKTIKEEADE